MQKVLVTGATGFIGNYVVEELLQRNYHVIASSASEATAKQKNWFAKTDYLPLDLKFLKKAKTILGFLASQIL